MPECGSTPGSNTSLSHLRCPTSGCSDDTWTSTYLGFAPVEPRGGVPGVSRPPRSCPRLYDSNGCPGTLLRRWVGRQGLREESEGSGLNLRVWTFHTISRSPWPVRLLTFQEFSVTENPRTPIKRPSRFHRRPSPSRPGRSSTDAPRPQVSCFGDQPETPRRRDLRG